MDGGEAVKMSTRKANYITLDQLVDEVGADVVRYFFNMRNITTHMNFDLSLAKKQSDENPVFYLQYAHARICSILKMIEKENLKASIDNLSLLTANEKFCCLKSCISLRMKYCSAPKLSRLTASAVTWKNWRQRFISFIHSVEFSGRKES